MAALLAEEVVEVEVVAAVGGHPRSAVTARLQCLTETEVPRPAVTEPGRSAPWPSVQPREQAQSLRWWWGNSSDVKLGVFISFS